MEGTPIANTGSGVPRLTPDSSSMTVPPLAGAAAARSPVSRARRWSSAWSAIFAPIAIVAIGVLVVTLNPKGAPRLNPNMTFRTLPVLATSITYPGMSQDGRWVTYPASDAGGSWDLYVMNVNDSASRRVTHDSSAVIAYVDVSPDGGRIAYAAVPRGSVGREEVRVVSSRGGASTVVAPDGNATRWSPDGERVGYIRVPRYGGSKHTELWSVRFDGTDRRQEYVDTLSMRGRISFSWSPDRKWFAWIRSYPQGHQELFAIPVNGGKERQLTRDRKNIDEVFWTHQNEIIFSSNRGGNTNLWTVRATGGRPAQITKGGGPDIGMRVSADGKTLLYLQQQPVNRLWMLGLDGTEPPRTLSGGEGRLGMPVLSADGREIAVAVIDPDPIKLISHLMIMSRDGMSRRQLTMGDEVVSSPAWGPVGRRLGYVARAATEPLDSLRVFVIDEPGKSAARPIVTAGSFKWLDSETILAERQGQCVRVSVATGAAQPIGQDSLVTIARPEWDYQLISDMHSATAGLHMRRTRADGTADTVVLVSKATPGIVSPDGKMVARHKNGDLVLVDLPSLRERLIPGHRALLQPWEAGSLSWDRRELVFTELILQSKLVLVENLK